MDRLRNLFACSSLSLLAACGGGGGGGVIDAEATGIEKYMGTWTGCMTSPGDAASTRVTRTMTKTSASSATIVEQRLHYPSTATCAGTPADPRTDEGTITFAGTILVNGESTDRVDIAFVPSQGLSTKSMLVLRSDGKLYGPVAKGEPGATVDAQGYPSAIDPKLAFSRPNS